MKRKNIATIVFGVIVVVITAGLLYRYLAPPTKNNNIEVIVPRPVISTFDQNQLSQLTNPALKNYTPDITPNFGDKPKPF